MVPYPPATVEASRERLFAGPFELVPNVALRSITPDSVEAVVLGTRRAVSRPADTVVVVTYGHANRELADHLAEPLTGRGVGVHLVGDVTGTSSILDAVHQASAVARAL